MIKFFRQIRYKLMNENPSSTNVSTGAKTGKPASRTGKYLAYAIGEIILVVIGILIALSINNWNQKRVIKAQEEKILNTLLSDLQQGKASSIRLLEREEQLSSGIAKILSGKEYRNMMAKSDTADSLYGRAIWHQVGQIPVINTFTDLKNSGQTSLISNEDIRIKFTTLENSLNQLDDQVGDRLNYQQMHCDKWAINTDNFVRLLQFSDFDYDIDYGPVNDYTQMFNNQGFLNLIAGKLQLSEGVIKDRNSLLSEINALIDLLELELKENQ